MIRKHPLVGKLTVELAGRLLIQWAKMPALLPSAVYSDPELETEVGKLRCGGKLAAFIVGQAVELGHEFGGGHRPARSARARALAGTG
jgi:hypothetical protein